MSVTPTTAAIAVLLASLLVGTARADANSDKTAREVARAAAEAAAREAYKSWADAGAASGAIGSGTATLAGIDIALAANDFANAKTDKQRFYAGLRAAAAGYVLASGPYAPIVAVAVAVASIAESAMAAKHAETLLEIYARIEEHNKRYIEIQTMLAVADAAAFDTLIWGARKSIATAAEAESRLKKSCQQVSAISTLEQLDQCALWLSVYYASARSFVEYSDRLLAWRSQLLQLDKAFELVEMKPSDLKAARDAFASVLELETKSQTAFFERYSEASLALILAKVSDSPTFSSSEYVSLGCIDTAGQLVRKVNRLSIEASSLDGRRTKHERVALQSKYAELKEALGLFSSGVCPQFADATSSADSLNVRTWVRLVKDAERGIAKKIRSTT